MKKNILSQFMDKLLAFPLWVKQVIFILLYEDLEKSLAPEYIITNKDEFYSYYKPTISYKGSCELEEHVLGLDNNIYSFLTGCQEGYSILEIALSKFWTMEEVSKYFVFCIEQDFLKQPIPNNIFAMANFMAGKYRTGEYFKRCGKINVDDLNAILARQREMKEAGENKFIAEIMIDMGYIKEDDRKSLMILKEEAKKRFILDKDVVPEASESTVPLAGNAQGTAYNSDIELQIKQLKDQNQELKTNLSRLLAYVKKNVK